MKQLLIALIFGFSVSCFGQINTTLRNELLEIYKSDQGRPLSSADKDFLEKWNKQNKIDSLNLIRVSIILDSIGFPGKSKVGDTAYLATFYVVQHSNLKAMEKYLPIFQKAADQNEIEWRHVALLIDRVKVYKNEKQIFGTQIQCIKDPKTGYCTNKVEIAPIEDEKNVDIRRKKVGLDLIEDFAKGFGIKYESKK
jgi:hypothetical protein